MSKNIKEWFHQADYDMRSAQLMFDNRRYIHAVFFCHLSIEKALKGLLAKTSDDVPPKTHNLIFLIEKSGLTLPVDMFDFMFLLNGVSVPTRYPDELKRMQKDYSKAKAGSLLEQGQKALKWLKAKSKE